MHSLVETCPSIRKEVQEVAVLLEDNLCVKVCSPNLTIMSLNPEQQFIYCKFLLGSTLHVHEHILSVNRQ